MITGYFLATLNALLNSSSALFMLLGYRAVRARRLEAHRKYMLAAVVSSALFLTSYLTRYSLFGDTPFAGEGLIRYVYFAILIPHVLLAALVAPGVVYTVMLGLRDDRATHKRWAKRVLPIWAYVSVTGVLVYLFLYQFFPSY